MVRHGGTYASSGVEIKEVDIMTKSEGSEVIESAGTEEKVEYPVSPGF